MTWNIHLTRDDEGNVTGKVVGQLEEAPKEFDVNGWQSANTKSVSVNVPGLSVATQVTNVKE